MAANKDRGEFDIHLGGQTRTLRFRSTEVALLEERLGKDVMAFIGERGGSTRFLKEALFCGLVTTQKRDDAITPGRISKWIDDAADLDTDATIREILFAVARGKPKLEGERMVRVLDEAFEEVQNEKRAEGEAGPTP